MPGWQLSFGGFQFDLEADRLWGDGHAVPLPARDRAVLRCLLVRSGQVVSTDEILEAVWGDLFVTRGVVKVSIRRVRAALGDTAEAARFIETVGRQGYRFLAPVQREEEVEPIVARRSPEAPDAPSRAAELERLGTLLGGSSAGGPRVVFVGGAGGSALVEEFVASLDGVVCGRGRCIEQRALGEPYLPWLAALESLCCGPLASEVQAALRRHAPLWLAQLPGVVAPAARAALARESAAAAPQRMLREFCDAASAIASLRPLVVLLEELHECDAATLGLLCFLAQRRDASRLLVVATLRPEVASASLRAQLDRLCDRDLAVEIRAPRAEAGDATRQAQRARLARTPFVGREDEIERLAERLEAARSGSGGLAFVVGEPGMGKTRLLEELAAWARADGVRILWGRCFEGDLARPYGPFAEAIAQHAAESDPGLLREDLAGFGPVVAKIAPELRRSLADLPDALEVEPGEDRQRVLDAVAQLLWTLARSAPVLLVLDDLHWADGGTLALLRHVARFLARHRVLVLGAYRKDEVDRAHPVAATVEALRRELDVAQVALAGLDGEAVARLLAAMTDRTLPRAFVDRICSETAGNPLFVRETMLRVLESRGEGDAGDSWHLSIDEIGVPDGVREVIGRRISRLPEPAIQLLATASGCAGAFRFDVAAAAAGLAEPMALDALDAALDAGLLRPSGAAESYEFGHALIRHALYTDMSPSRQLRLHRRLAEEMERRFAGDAASHAFEIAQQWHRSAALPGAERGVEHCLAAADRAAQAAAHEDAAMALRMALDLSAANDPRRPRLLARLALALAWSLATDEAIRVAGEAADLLAERESDSAAADYLAEAAIAVYGASLDGRSWALAERGLRHIGTRRDRTWALLRSYALEQQPASDPELQGMVADTPEIREIVRLLFEGSRNPAWPVMTFHTLAPIFTSRADAIERADRLSTALGFFAGDYVRSIESTEEGVARNLERGQLARAAMSLAQIARCRSALGDLAASQQAFARAVELAERVGTPTVLAMNLLPVPLEHMGVCGTGYAVALASLEEALARPDREARVARAAAMAAAAACYARLDRVEEALCALDRARPAIERAPGWAMNYTLLIWQAIATLWFLGSKQHAELLERNLREKTLAPDFRYPHTDARLALARLCAVTGRFEEARSWFGEARRVLDEQGARPLRAITDFDEAWMELRRGRDADRERARALLDATRAPFAAIGMTGWQQRADELRESVGDAT